MIKKYSKNNIFNAYRIATETSVLRLKSCCAMAFDFSTLYSKKTEHENVPRDMYSIMRGQMIYADFVIVMISCNTWCLKNKPAVAPFLLVQ